MASRKIADLHPEFAPRVAKFMEKCRKIGLDIIILCTYRSWIEQEKLHSQGRILPGKKVTEYRPGHSKHNNMLEGRPASLAIDILPIKDGKPVSQYKDPVWLLLGDIAAECGMVWSGSDPNRSEVNHFEMWGR